MAGRKIIVSKTNTDVHPLMPRVVYFCTVFRVTTTGVGFAFDVACRCCTESGADEDVRKQYSLILLLFPA